MAPQGASPFGTPSTSTIAPLGVLWGCAPAPIAAGPSVGSLELPHSNLLPDGVAASLQGDVGPGLWELGVLGLQWPEEHLSHSGTNKCWGHLFVARSPWCKVMSGQWKAGTAPLCWGPRCHPAPAPGCCLLRLCHTPATTPSSGVWDNPLNPTNGHQCLGCRGNWGGFAFCPG